ncbi:MAG: Fic family protein [Cytophagaceae bacterium]|nr:MAG: Fic family protein [Cytophagaceae bacterium]
MDQCPEWQNDASEHSAPACYRAVKNVCEAAGAKAIKVFPEEYDIKSWHFDMFHALVPLPYYAGRFRGTYSGMECLARDVHVNNVDAVPFQLVTQAMAQLCDNYKAQLRMLEVAWDNTSSSERARRLAVIIGSTIGTYIRIHPFLNGNGRTSRLFWRILLHRMGLPPQATIIRRPDSPYDNLMASAMVGNNIPLIAAILNSITQVGVPTKLP